MNKADQYERHVRRLQRRAKSQRSHYRLLLLLVVMGLMMILLFELGRTLAYSQEVGEFINTLGQRDRQLIKVDLYRYSRGFSDYNPVIRRASMTAFQMATGQSFGDNPKAWQVWWIENQLEWQYQPPPAPSP